MLARFTADGRDPLLTEVAAAKFLNVSTRTLQSWRGKDRGPAYIKVGRAIRYRSDDLLTYVESNTVRCKFVSCQRSS
jgi:helix-turn-helix protein